MRMAKSHSTGNTKSWQGRRATGTVIRRWWGCKNGTATLADSLGVPHKTEHIHQVTHQSSSVVFIQMSWKVMFTQNLHTDVYGSFIHDHQNLEATKMSPVCKWISKLCTSNGILFSTKIWRKYMQSTKWKKPIWKGRKLYNSNHMTFWKRQTVATVKRSVAAKSQRRKRDEWVGHGGLIRQWNDSVW